VPVVVVKRKHGDQRDRWRWDGDLVGTAGPGWRVVRHVRGVHERRLVAARTAEPQTATELRWLGTRAPATILVKLDEADHVVETKVDAALPVRLRAGRLVFTDLDVDVVRDAAGTVTVRDWDTFESRVAVLGYTDATRAVAAAGEAFGLRLLAAWSPALDRDVAGIVAATGIMAAPPTGHEAGRDRTIAPWLRRAGCLWAGGGETVLWSVAEGRRGRRWRSLRRDAAGSLLADLLLEVDLLGRWARLELTTAAGILTLHPDPDGRSAHGNFVTAAGVRHLARPWGNGHRLVVEGEPVAAGALAAANPLGAGPGLVVSPDLAVTARPDVASPPVGWLDGLPGPSWPLEVADGEG
jgi:hypothetical protein